jgi:antitoxin FitA
MADLLVRGIEPALKRQIKERARRHGRSLSAEAKALLRGGLAASAPPEKFGTWLFSLVPEEARGDDLVFEIDDRSQRAQVD